MHFDLTDDDRTLVDAVRKVCEGGTSWAALAEAGVFDLRDLGMGWAEAVLVYEELGRALVPGPLVASHLAPTDGVVGAVEDGADLVAHLDDLDTLVVVSDRGIRRVDPRNVDAEPVADPLDPATPLHRIRALPDGEPLDVDPAWWRLHGALLTAALLAGIASRVTDLAVAYAKQREQFGRPIGSFQAVKHLCADMHVRAEVARAAVHAAGVTTDAHEIRGARTLAAKAAVANSKASIQVHGGMGFTWEVDVHRYLKRAVVLSTEYTL